MRESSPEPRSTRPCRRDARLAAPRRKPAGARRAQRGHRASTSPNRRSRSSPRSTARTPVAQLARAARMDVGAVSRQLAACSRTTGYVTKAASPDQRSVVLVRGDRARPRVARRVANVRNGHLAHALGGWTAADRRTLAVLLRRLVDDLQATPYTDGASPPIGGAIMTVVDVDTHWEVGGVRARRAPARAVARRPPDRASSRSRTASPATSSGAPGRPSARRPHAAADARASWPSNAAAR